MDRCSEFQNLMLDYVYDLLDPDVREHLCDHLHVCPACQAVLCEARGQQTLLAAAARLEFPAVRFAPPVSPAPAAPQPQPAPVVLARPVVQRRSVPWRRLAAAAVLLVAVGLPSALGLDYAGARRDLTRRQESLAKIDDERNTVISEMRALDESFVTRYTERETEIRKKHTVAAVSGPQTYIPGAPNTYQFHLRDGRGEPVSGKIKELRVIDRGQVVFRETDVPLKNGDARVTMPPGVETGRPGSMITLEARFAAEGQDATLQEDFLLTAPTYLTHLATDRPLYQPGDTVRFRSLTLERFSLRPAEEPLRLAYQVTTPQSVVISVPQFNVASFLQEGSAGGAAVFRSDNKMLRGIGGGQWDIPTNFEGGEYILTVSELNNRFPPQQRKFIVNKYQKTRLHKELTFNKRSYGPGDVVQAECTVTAAGTPFPCSAEVSVQVDKKTYDAEGKESAGTFSFKSDDKGKVIIRFKLPEKIDRGQASVSVWFTDGKTGEQLLKPIPIVLNKLDVEFYPEGGDLVHHVPCRVYFQVRTTLGKPAELKGRVVESSGDVVAYVETLADDKEPGANQGMGVFIFTPRPGKKYHLEIDRPTGIADRPEIKVDGNAQVAMTIPRSVTMSHEPFEVRLRSKEKTRHLLVGAYCRGRLFDHARIVAPAGEDVSVTLNPVQGIGGVYRVTVFEEEGSGERPRLSPVAERLIFRSPRERLNLEVALATKKKAEVVATAPADKDEKGKDRSGAFVPGDKVGLTLLARGENQEPVPGVLMIGVIDRAVTKMADEKTARSMPTHFLLTSEVRKPEELEFADFLLTSHPRAVEALDLLLGTQGWRRFAEQKPGEVRERLGEENQALHAIINPIEVPRVHKAQGQGEEHRSLALKLQAEAERLNGEMAPQRAKLEKQAKELREQREQETASAEYQQASRHVERYRTGFGIAMKLWPLYAFVLFGAACWLIGRGLTQAPRRALLNFAGSVCCLGLCTLLLVLDLQPKDTNQPQVLLDGTADRFEGFDRKWVAGVLGDGAADDRRRAVEDLGRDIPPAVKRPLAEDEHAKFDQGFPSVPAPPPPTVPPMVADPRKDGMAGGGFGGGLPGGAIPPGAGAFGLAGGFGGGGPIAPTRGGTGDKPGGPHMGFPENRFQHVGPQVAQQLGGEQQKAGEGKEGALLKYVDDGWYKGDGKDIRALDKAKKQSNLQERAALRREYNALRDKQLAGGDQDLATFFVREYAHTAQPREAGKLGVRNDRIDTVYWHPALVLPDGKVDVWFTLGDAVTSYDVIVYGHTLDGRLAAAKPFSFDARLPLALDSKTPLQVTASDKVIVPVTVANNTNQPRDVTVRLQSTEGLKQLKELEKKPESSTSTADVMAVQSYSTYRRLYHFEPAAQGTARLRVEGLAQTYADALERTFDIVPDGFPIVESRSDLLEGREAVQKILLPRDRVPGTVRLRLQGFPSTLADLQQGLEGLLREPHGCFEQASTANYPNVLILGYLKETDQAKPELERRARELMANGYQKLTSYECQPPGSKRQGYEWFGGSAPPHEALTAYGLLQFRDMARHGEVDPAMLERTRKYLLSRRDGKGGFERNPRALDTFGRAPDHVTNAYIVWALTESGPEDDLKPELNALVEKAKDSKDPYFLSLVANSLINRDRRSDAIPLLKKVQATQAAAGHVDGAETSITGSGGRDLQIESTALALLAWLKANTADFAPNIANAAKWIGQQRGGYGAFGSTQSTILALRALIAHAKQNKRPRDDGDLKLFVNDQLAGSARVSKESSDTLVIDVAEPEKLLRDGENTLRVEVTGKNQFPYTLSCTYQALTPNSAKDCAVKLSTALGRTKVNEGETVRMTVKLENTRDKGQGMAVAIVGLPGGLSLPEDFKQLRGYKDLPKDGSRPLISTFEVRGRELILYWRDLAPKQVIEVPVDLMCRVPGEYSGPASRAYLYYNSDRKTWVEPLRVNIAPRE